MRPKEHSFPVRSAPGDAAPVVGTLVVRAEPGRGLRASYRAGPSASPTEFTPDLFDSDWGYGPYFHQTFLERRGRWFLLPAGPLPEPGWIELGGDPAAPVRSLADRDIIVTPWGDKAVVGVEQGALRVRAAQRHRERQQVHDLVVGLEIRGSRAIRLHRLAPDRRRWPAHPVFHLFAIGHAHGGKRNGQGGQRAL